MGWISIEKENVKELLRAILALDEQAIKIYSPDMGNIGEAFWPVVHAVRANYRVSGASIEQAQESLDWLAEHGQEAILEGFWQDEIDYRIGKSMEQDN